MKHELRLKIILKNPPVGVDFGLQEGSGIKATPVKVQRSTGKDLPFDFTVTVNQSKTPDSAPVFLGSFVQGPSTARFVYINIGTSAGQISSPWSRRLKVPLSGISWEMVSQSVERTDHSLETHVPGTGKDGSPNCGTVKPFSGWQIEALPATNPAL